MFILRKISANFSILSRTFEVFQITYHFHTPLITILFSHGMMLDGFALMTLNKASLGGQFSMQQ